MQQNIRNRVNFNTIPKPESKENILANFIGGLGNIGANVGRAAQQIGQGVATGAQTGGSAIGQGLKKMYETPEGKLALQSLIGEALIGVGQEDLGEGIQEYAQTVYTPNVQRQMFEQQTQAAQRSAQTKLEAENKKQITKLEDDYRKEYNTKKIVKDSKEINAAISRMDNVWNKYQINPNPNSKNALDQALIITFNKMLDPGSVVRESEFARTSTGQSLISKIQGASEKLVEGGVGLTDAERGEIVVVAKQIQEGQMIELEKEKELYRELAEQRGLNIDNILGKNKTKVPVIPKGTKTKTDSKSTTPKVYNPQTGEFE